MVFFTELAAAGAQESVDKNVRVVYYDELGMRSKSSELEVCGTKIVGAF